PLAVGQSQLQRVRPLLVALLRERVMERDASHRAGQLARPRQLVALPAGRAGGVPFAVVAGAGAHEALRPLVESPHAVDLQAGMLLRLLLLVREGLPEVVDDQLGLGASLHAVLGRRQRDGERLAVTLPLAEK